MSLESLTPTTYISGLSQTWPTSGEPKSQGDDHLRLIKGVLQNTFPNATMPFRFPAVTIASTAQLLTSADQSKVVMLATTGGDVAVTLPTLTAGDAGWSCEILKTTADTNGVVVTPASGTITSRVGNTASIRVGQVAEPAKLLWSGTAWFCFKPGVPIGTTINFDAATVPPGYLVSDGTAIPAVYVELIAVLGANLKDKKGRVEVGVDSAGVRLTAAYLGTAAILNAVGGTESHALTTAQMPSHNHGITDLGHKHLTGGFLAGVAAGGGSVSGVTSYPSTANGDTETKVTGITINNNGGGGGHPIVQPTIVVQKLVRAC